MNYGILVLGATIQISLFLRICSVSSEIFNDFEKTKLPFLKSQSSLEFQESIDYSPTVYSWLTGNQNYLMDKMVWDTFSTNYNSDEEEDMLRIFLRGRESYGLLRYDNDFDNEQNNSEKEKKDIGDYCESFGEVEQNFLQMKNYNNNNIRNESHENQTKIQDKYESVEFQNESCIPPIPDGCYYYNGDLAYTKYLICSDSNIKQLPLLPMVLDFFEMNTTSVPKLEKGAFSNRTIKRMRLIKNKITSVDRDAFKGVKGLTHVDISYNQICWIWFEFILGLNETTTLYLENNEIFLDREEFLDSNRTVDEYEPTLTSLIILSLSSNPLQIIPEMFFASLRLSPITYLSLKNCQLHRIHEDALIHLKKLIILDLSENPKLMPNLANAFHGIQNSTIQNLVLAYNMLQEIPKEALNLVASTLRELDLRGNGLLTTLSQDRFPESMPKLKSLNIGNCKISTISINAFNGMPALDTIILINNRLRVIPPAISNLPSLSVLDLSQQDKSDVVFQILPDTFKYLTKLRILNLNNVNLQSLIKSTFKGLIGLNMLVLENTKLSLIDDFTFDGLQSLRTLDLRNNPLELINSNTFYGLVNLQNLYLQSCNLIIPQGKVKSTIYDSTPLTEIFTSDVSSTTSMELLDSKLIVHKPVLDFGTVGRTIRDMIKNALGEEEELPTGITSEPFKYLTRLQYLYLENNKIRDLTPQLFQTMPYLHHIDLTKNSIELWQNRIFENNTVLEQLLLSYNSIISFTDPMLEDLKNLKSKPYLDMSGNPFICDKRACRLNDEVELGNISFDSWNISDKYTCTFPFPSFERIELSLLNNENICNPTLHTSTDKTSPLSTDKSPDTTSPLSTDKSPDTTSSLSTDKSPDTTSLISTTNGSSGRDNPQVSNESNYGGSSVIVTSVIIVSSCILIICGSIVFYKKRSYLKYFWFSAKYHIKKLPRKNRSSDLINSECQSYDYDVFISYSHHDSEFIQDYLVPELEGRGKLMDGNRNEMITVEIEGGGGVNLNNKDNQHHHRNVVDSFKVCLHERDFEIGTPITENIIECVDHSKKVIILISKKYLESQWCLFEMNLAYHRLIESRRKSFLVIVLEDIPNELRTKVLNYLMRSRTYIQWPGVDGTSNEKKIFWARLKSSLASED